MLARVSRRDGARTALLTLNRGEAGDNALGPELFDGLGLIPDSRARGCRTVLRGRRAVLHGRCRLRLLEAAGRSAGALGSRRGASRRGSRHPPHAPARRRVALAGQRARWTRAAPGSGRAHARRGAPGGRPVGVPELQNEGLRPWAVRKLFVGGVREAEPWNVRLDTNAYDPALGASYSLLGRLGLSMQRSQTSGRFDPYAAGQPLFYRRARPEVAPEHEDGFFQGLDISLPGLYALLGVPAPEGHVAALEAIAREVEAAPAAFAITDPSACVPPLARGLAAVRHLRDATADPDARFILEIKARQLEEALVSAASLELVAMAEPPRSAGDAPSPFAQPPTLGPVTPGQTVSVRVVATNRGLGNSRYYGWRSRIPAGR